MKELVLIGSGNMAIAYCEALKFLNIDFTVIGNSKEKAKEFTTKTGIKTIVDKVSEGLNVPCGCEARRKALNNLVPYNKQFKLKK